ncbi:hypothetical protein [Leucobacter musarum]|uniref:hypothetical protein n=1 Tax=Leucobacter musarum TaxID=1930747 RepID=UPI0006A767A7|nr:hypothetical protein [Leucobacter musarum]
MTAKKGPAPTEPIETENEQPTAEQILEAEAELEDVLADLPQLRPPHELRLAARNKIKTIRLEHGRDLVRIVGKVREGAPIADLPEDTQVEYLKHMMSVQEAVDEFAESIAIDRAGYIEWSNKHADDYTPFIALLFRYADAAGESNGSAS